MTEPKRYRLVTDYGHGDKTWVHRDLTLDQAIQAYMSSVNWQDRNDPPSLDQAMDNEYQVHYLEEDHPGDQEDWDWQDS